MCSMAGDICCVGFGLGRMGLVVVERGRSCCWLVVERMKRKKKKSEKIRAYLCSANRFSGHDHV
jgi:hypothetical protein